MPVEKAKKYGLRKSQLPSRGLQYVVFACILSGYSCQHCNSSIRPKEPIVFWFANQEARIYHFGCLSKAAKKAVQEMLYSKASGASCPFVSEKLLPVDQAVADLYTLLFVEPKMNPQTTFHTRMNKFNGAKERVISPLARAFYDYICLACASEMRYAAKHCTYYYSDIVTYEVKRNDAFEEARQYDPKEILIAAEALFSENWDGSYGGSSWCKIAQGGMLYGTIPDSVFIDHCVDLSHNNGLFLDKGIIFYLKNTTDYLNMMNAKKHDITTFAKFLIDRQIRVSSDVLPFWGSLVDEHQAAQILSAAPWRYTALKWGNKPFPMNSMERSEYYRGSEDDDSQDVEGSNEPRLGPETEASAEK